MLYSRSNHHLLSFNSNNRIQVCVWMPKRRSDEIFEDSLRISPREQNNSNNCRLFALALTTDILSGDSPANTTFNLSEM